METPNPRQAPRFVKQSPTRLEGMETVKPSFLAVTQKRVSDPP